MAAITDHWLQTTVNISKWILALARRRKCFSTAIMHAHTTHLNTHTKTNKLRIGLIPLAGSECENRKWHYIHTVLRFCACLQLHWVGGGSKVAGCNIKPSITLQIKHFTSQKRLQLPLLLPQVGSKPWEKRLHHKSNDGAARPMNRLYSHMYAENGRKVLT